MYFIHSSISGNLTVLKKVRNYNKSETAPFETRLSEDCRQQKLTEADFGLNGLKWNEKIWSIWLSSETAVNQNHTIWNPTIRGSPTNSSQPSRLLASLNRFKVKRVLYSWGLTQSYYQVGWYLMTPICIWIWWYLFSHLLACLSWVYLPAGAHTWIKWGGG